ncbi:PRC-barrel domain-containing protein [Streptomyces goshikiensis]|uniref:PRC-barrel domain-containing protein n=1 Tax=Streptomyces goshikiensis TaxID=1942 RepID=UPI0037B8A972
MQTDIDPRSLIGRKAFDRNGTKIGTIDEVYLDDATGVPEWAAVRTGLFSRDAFVPLEPSEMVGDTLRVPFERSLIRDAPDFGVGRHLSPEQELQLYHHYGLDVALPSDFRRSLPPAPGSDRDRDFGRLAGDDG